MPKIKHYGKPSTFPYYFNVYEDGKKISVSGVFKTKKACRESAKRFSRGKKESYRIIDRRK